MDELTRLLRWMENLAVAPDKHRLVPWEVLHQDRTGVRSVCLADAGRSPVATYERMYGLLGLEAVERFPRKVIDQSKGRLLGIAGRDLLRVDRVLVAGCGLLSALRTQADPAEVATWLWRGVFAVDAPRDRPHRPVGRGSSLAEQVESLLAAVPAEEEADRNCRALFRFVLRQMLGLECHGHGSPGDKDTLRVPVFAVARTKALPLFLRLKRIAGGKGGLVRRPHAPASQPLLSDGFCRELSLSWQWLLEQEPSARHLDVVWEVELLDDPKQAVRGLDGSSHGAAVLVGLTLLARGLSYDPAVVFVAERGEGDRLKSAQGVGDWENAKLWAARALHLRPELSGRSVTVVVAEGRLPSEADLKTWEGRGVRVVELPDVAAGVALASGGCEILRGFLDRATAPARDAWRAGLPGGGPQVTPFVSLRDSKGARHEDTPPAHWPDVLDAFCRDDSPALLVSGHDNSGKTSALRLGVKRLADAWLAADDAGSPLPVYLSARALLDRPGLPAEQLAAYLRDPPRSDPAAAHVLALYEQGHALVVLDGVHEAPESALEAFLLDAKRRGCKVIASAARLSPESCEPRWFVLIRAAFGDVPVWQVEPFTDAQINDYCAQADLTPEAARKVASLRRSGTVPSLSSSPFLLAMSCWVARDERAGLPQDANSTQVHRLVLEKILREDLGDWPPAAEKRHGVDQTTRLRGWWRLLPRVAWWFFLGKKGRGLASHDELCRRMEASGPAPMQTNRTHREEIAESLVEELVERRFLIKRPASRYPNGPEYGLPSRSFLEYLSALALADLVHDEERRLGLLPCPPGGPWRPALLAHEEAWAFVGIVLHLPDYDGVLAFLAGLLDDPCPLFEAIVNAATGDGPDSRLQALFGRCLAEVRGEARSREFDGRLAELVLRGLSLLAPDDEDHLAERRLDLSRLPSNELVDLVGDEDAFVGLAAVDLLGKRAPRLSAVERGRLERIARFEPLAAVVWSRLVGLIDGHPGS